MSQIERPTEVPETFGHDQHPELTQAERAGFLRGLGVAGCCLRGRGFPTLAGILEALDGHDGADVREHCSGVAQS